MHRIAGSQRYGGSGLVEIQTLWSIDDLMDAHDVLDLYESLGG